MDKIKTSYKKQNQFLVIMKRLAKNKTAIIGGCIFLLFALMIIFADLIVNYDVVVKQDLAASLQGPSAEHFFGTDFYGRDIFARIVHGARISLSIGLVCLLGSITAGIFLGSLCGYIGGRLDYLVMRLMDAFSAIPGMLLTLALVAALGTGVDKLIIAIIISDIPSTTRLVRSAVLTISGSDYIEAAAVSGAKTPWIILRHVLPNAIGPIIVHATMGLGFLIINISGLSFLGMGIQPPSPEWGAMLSEGREFIRSAPHTVIFPGLAIMMVALSLNLLGDGLRDALDPRLKK